MIKVGDRIKGYEIVAELSAGEMATLYLARRSVADGVVRHVAIKVVHPRLASDGTYTQMFLDEARVLARVEHASVVHLEDFGEAGGACFLAMEYVRGCTLAQVLGALARKRRRLAPELACHVAIQARPRRGGEPAIDRPSAAVDERHALVRAWPSALGRPYRAHGRRHDRADSDVLSSLDHKLRPRALRIGGRACPGSPDLHGRVFARKLTESMDACRSVERGGLPARIDPVVCGGPRCTAGGLLACLIAALALGACKADPSELVVVVQTDLLVPGELDRVEFRVTGATDASLGATGLLTGPAAQRFPLTLGLVADGDRAGPVGIRVLGFRGALEVVAREVRTRFVDGERRMVYVPLLRRCLEVSTPCPGQTCGESGCRAIDVPTGELPPWTGTVPTLDASAPADDHPDIVLDVPRDQDATVPRDTGADVRVDTWIPCTDSSMCPARCVAGRCVGVRAVAAGGWHTCAVLEDGSLWCWGWNDSRQLGYTTMEDHSTVPGQLGMIGSSPVLAIDLGMRSSCALAADRRVFCWGNNGNGELARPVMTVPSEVPMPVADVANVLGMSVGWAHTCVRTMGNLLSCWGDNRGRQLGYDDGVTCTGGLCSITARPVPGLSGVVEPAAGGLFTCANLTDGTVQCWGNNADGTLGNNTTASHTRPETVVGLSHVTQIVAGEAHACALMSGTATVRCWGNNNTGQLGDGSRINRLGPMDVSGATGATQLAAGATHTCAVIENNTVRCWGSNARGSSETEP